jgi:VWFA-related protein
VTQALSQLWIQKLGWTLLHFLWQGTAIAMVYAAARGALRRSLGAQGRYVMACCALAAMTATPFATYFLIVSAAPLPAPSIPWSIPATAWQRLLPTLVALWLAGVLTFSIRIFGGWRLIAQLRRASHPAAVEWQRTLEEIAARMKMSQPVRLLMSSLVEVPTVIGWLRPVILVPVSALTGLPPEHVTALLAHELAHILRRDYIAGILQSIAEALLFYHPAVWWISGQLRAERELCCDDLAVAASGDVLLYARALAELESIQPARLRPALAANGGSLVNRIRRLIEPAQSAVDALPGPAASWAMVLLWVAGLGIAAAQASQPHVRVARLIENSPVVALVSSEFSPVSAPEEVTAPTVMSGLASHARKTLLFDPFLPVVREAPRPAPVIILDESTVPPLAEAHALQNPLSAVAGSEMKLVAKLRPEPRKTTITPASEHVIRSTTHLVQAEVTVRDAKGPIRDLTQADFELFDNGVPQRIGAFSVNESGASPTATVMLIDRIGASFEDDVQSRQRVAEVLNAMPPSEPVAVYMLDAAAGFHKVTDAREGSAWQAHGAPSAALPSQFDVLEEIANQLATVPGRKKLIWIASSFPSEVTETQNALLYRLTLRTLHALNSANVAIYPIAAQGLSASKRYIASAARTPFAILNSNPGPQIEFNTMYWAQKTGGLAAFNTDPGTAIERAFEDARVTYTLGFYPETMDGGYHQLKILVTRAGTEVRNRQGYLAAPERDLVTERIPGETLESQLASNPDAATLTATMQLPYFYTGTNRANVHLALDLVPEGMKFEKTATGLHGEINLVATGFLENGETAARFADTVAVGMEDQAHADAFTHTPWHYEHDFTVAPGTYVFQMEVVAGPDALGKVEMPINVEPWNATNFGIGGIAFSTEAHKDLSKSEHGMMLAAGGKEFVAAATSSFHRADRVYFYTEIYNPGIKEIKPGENAPALAMQYRVVDRRTGTVIADSGLGSVRNFMHPGEAVIPFATTLPISKLQPGAYRLEIRAAHSDAGIVGRTIDFDVN